MPRNMIVHISTNDQEGGSARSAWRLHSGLLVQGVQSRMLVGWKKSDAIEVEKISVGRWGQKIDEITNILLQKIGWQYRFVPSNWRVPKHPFIRQARLFQLYNLHGGYFDPSLLRKLSKQAPLVWRLSDLWPITGHCAYPGPCQSWLNGCGNCPDLKTYPPIGRDTTAALWERKKEIYRDCRLTIVAPSSWTEASARKSPLLSGFEIVCIPNGIDTSLYQPGDRDAARRKLGIVTEKPAVLFLAHIAHDNPRKGTDILKKALSMLVDPEKFAVIIVGIGAECWRDELPSEVFPLNYMTDEQDLVAAYRAADLVVIPSAVENLPNTVLEAISCGKPVVAIDVGGIGDAVQHGETGLLCPPGDVPALARALHRLLSDFELRKKFGRAGRKLAKEKFDLLIERQKFITLYETLAPVSR